MPPADAPPAWLLARRRAIGDRIRAVRLHHNLTQERLGEQADVDRQQINRIEQGRSSPKLDTLLRLAEALGVDLADLVRTPQ